MSKSRHHRPAEVVATMAQTAPLQPRPETREEFEHRLKCTERHLASEQAGLRQMRRQLANWQGT